MKRARQIFVVDDVLPNTMLLAAYLQALGGVETHLFQDPLEALEAARGAPPDLVLLDYAMPQMNGIEFCQRLRGGANTASVPVVVVTAQEDPEVLYAALEAGASDFLRKPVDPVELRARARNMLELRAREKALEKANEELRRVAATDSLTGLANRGAVMRRLEAELSRFARGHGSLCVAMIDADKFKRINDTLGHAAGDAVLATLAERFRTCVRGEDEVGRTGGEEFLVVLGGTSATAAVEVAGRLVGKVAETPMDIGSGHLHPVTVSVGVAEAMPGDTIEALVAAADLAMYEAKRAGGNRFVVAARGDADLKVA